MLNLFATRKISNTNSSQSLNKTLHTIRFLLNGKLVELSEGQFDPTDSLVTYLRSEDVKLKGTKRACNEGGCGSCTVIMSSFDPVLQRVKHRAINSCLMPIGNLHKTSITTIERLTQNSNDLNPIQKAIKKHHATQCGFCTPGIVMSTLALLLENPTPTNEDIFQYLDGNVCRCTGYRAILEALREFTIDSNPNDQIIAQNIRNKKDDEITISEKKNLNKEIIDSLNYLSDLSPLQSSKESISIKYNNHLYSIPSTFGELVELKKKNPKSKIIVGNTELFSSEAPNDKFDYISTNLLNELKYIRKSGNILHIGASTVIDDVFDYCKKDTTNNRVLRALKEKISVFASNQTRNVASIIGNIVIASPSTDFTNFLPGVGARVKIFNCISMKEKETTFDNFFLDRYKTTLQDTDIIKEISFNLDSLVPEKKDDNTNTDHIFVYKIANRREIAGCILSSTIRADISEKTNIINGIKIALSKLSNTNPIGRAKKAEKYLIGKEFNLNNIKKSFKFIDEEFPINPEIDDDLDNYRRTLGHNLLIKFYHQTQKERGKSNEYDESIVNDSYFSTTFSIDDKKPDYFELSSSHVPELSVSCQCKKDGTTVPLDRVKGSEALGKSVTHLASSLQVQGKAEYTDDIPLEVNAKHAAFVTSTIAHGNIKRINYDTDELKSKKFTIITAKDLVKGANKIGFNNEEFLVSKEVTYYGQPIAIIVADNEREAWRIAKMVEVEYDPLPVNSSLEESIKNGKAFKGPSLSGGRKVDEIFKEIESGKLNSNLVVLNGSVRMGGQYAFYLEPNASVASHTSDGDYTIQSTTRDLSTARGDAAKHLGIDENRVNVEVKRLGGCFCSKLNRVSIVSNATAIASQKVGCQVKMRLPRDVDTHVMAGDHSVLAKYKVAFDAKSGMIEALKIDYFVDSGFSYKSNAGLVEKILAHTDSVYNFRNYEFNSFLCQTNKISNAHFRGYGAQNAGVAIESIFERIIHHQKKSNVKDDIKHSNFYRPNDKTPLGVVLDDINIDQCWSLIKDKSRYDELKRCVDAFNVISKHKKRGLSITPVKFGVGHGFAPGRRGSSVVHLLKDGTVLICHSGVEQGQGLHTKMACLAAKVLDIPVDLIHIESTNTSVNTEGMSTGAGYTNDVIGFAIIDACEKIRKRIERFYFAKDKNGQKVRRPFSDVVKMAYFSKEDLTAHGFYISPEPGFNFEKKEGSLYQYYEYGAGVALVEIDLLTGQNKILESHVVFDAGQSLNPGIDIGQIEGGFMQGVGWMTSEQTCYMKNKEKLNLVAKHGKPLNDTMYKYKIPTWSSLPLKFSAHLLPDSHNKIGVMSSKGVGEPPNMLANCVGFAMIDAIEAGRKDNGKGLLNHYEFPLTPDKVLYYLNI